MNTTLKPYPEYRDSGLPWIGKIPKHWDLQPNRALLNYKKEQVGSESQKYTLLSLTLSGVVPRDMEDPKGKFPSNFDSYQVIDPGDLVFCLFDIDETPRAVGIVREKGMITGAYSAFSCDDESARDYLYRLYLHLDTHKALKPLYTGLRKVIKTSTFLRTKSPIPPRNGASPDYAFFKRKERQFNHLIHAKERLIELLEEQKQAIIQRAVTRGLNPYVEMKDSGVDWLGEVPKHWEMRKLKHMASFSGGGTPSKDVDSFWEGEIPWVSPKDMKSYYVDNTEDHISSAAINRSSTNLIEPGSVLIVVRSGILQRKIPVAINTCDVTINQDLKAIEVSDILTAEYLAAFIRGNQQSLLFAWRKRGATVESIEHRLMANSILPVPPLGEQSKILRYVKRRSKKIDSAIEKARSEITLIREYRTRLIADVVTGRLDVRGTEAAQLGSEMPNDLDADIEEQVATPTA